MVPAFGVVTGGGGGWFASALQELNADWQKEVVRGTQLQSC